MKGKQFYSQQRKFLHQSIQDNSCGVEENRLKSTGSRTVTDKKINVRDNGCTCRHGCSSGTLKRHFKDCGDEINQRKARKCFMKQFLVAATRAFKHIEKETNKPCSMQACRLGRHAHSGCIQQLMFTKSLHETCGWKHKVHKAVS